MLASSLLKQLEQIIKHYGDHYIVVRTDDGMLTLEPSSVYYEDGNDNPDNEDNSKKIVIEINWN